MPKGIKGSAVCGTPSGYQAHRRRDERPCRACIDAKTAYARARRLAKKAEATKFHTMTIAVNCPLCASAVQSLNQRRTRAELIAIVACSNRNCGYQFIVRLTIVPAYADEIGDPIKCGTEAGAQRHYRRGEEVCDACRLAHNEKQQKRRAA